MNDGVASDGLGWSVAISGNTIVAGAPDATADMGAAYVFTRPAPSAAITSPANGARYTQGQVVTAQASPATISQLDGSGLATCTGLGRAWRADRHPGARTAIAFTVTATDNAGASSSQTVHYTVVLRP